MIHIDENTRVLSTSTSTGELLNVMAALCEPAGVTVLINALERRQHVSLHSGALSVAVAGLRAEQPAAVLQSSRGLCLILAVSATGRLCRLS